MISIKNLVKTYTNKESKVVALNNVNLELPDAGFILVTGESGSGKTTFLNILAGFDTIDSGSFIVNGTDFSKFRQKDLDEWRGQETAFVFQEYNLISDYTVAENIKIGKNFQGENCTEAQISKVLKDVKLQEKENRMLQDLSGGEKQRVAIARALIRSPKVLFVDEPSGNLDKVNAKKILMILKKISKTVLVICVSHDFDLMKKYADRHIKLNKGKITINKTLGKKKKVKKTVGKPKKKEPEKIEIIKKKTNHKIKHLISIGTNNITRNKSRVFSLILLSSAALLFFSVFYMLSGYNSYVALAKSVLHESPYYITFSDTNISGKKYQQIEEKYDGIDFFKFVNVNWQNMINGLIEVAAPEVNAVGNKNIFGQEIWHGKYPILTEPSGYNIVITDYIADKIINGQLEIRNEGGTSVVNVNRPEEIIGKTIRTEKNFYLTICGIIKTDYERYSMAMPGTSEYDVFAHNLDAVYTTIHVAPGFINSFAAFTGMESTDFKNVEIKGVGTYKVVLASSDFIGNQSVFLPEMNGNYDGALDAGQIIVSYDIFSGIENNDEGFEINLSINNGEYNSYIIVGVLQTGAVDDSSIIFSDIDFNGQGIIKKAIFPVTKLLVVTNSVRADTLGELIHSLETNYEMTFKSGTVALISDFSDRMLLLKSTLIVFGIFSLVFSCALLYDYVSRIISEKKRNIGIIRSLGATSGDIAIILFTTITVIFISCFILSAVFTAVAGFMINVFVTAGINIPFNVVNLSWDLYLILFCATLTVCSLASVIPIIRYSNQPPARQIKVFN